MLTRVYEFFLPPDNQAFFGQALIMREALMEMELSTSLLVVEGR